MLGERAYYPPFGVNGGGPGALNRFVFTVGDEERSPPLGAKITGVVLNKGKRIRLETPGGGGWGDPAKRPVEQVMRDIRLGYIAAGDAAIYAVALSPDGTLDEATTASLRERAA